MRIWICRLAAALVLVGQAGCGGSNSSAPAPPPKSDTIDAPTAVDLYPAATADDGNRLFIMVRAVGTATVAMPLAFDTGSAGITLYAPDIFPASMVGSGGFVFASDQTTITYNGITVTNQVGTRKFGSPTTGKTQTGNIGYATVTFGDGGGELITAVMPVFLYYLITDNSTGQAVPPPAQRGWFGVNDAANLVNVAGSTEPATGFPACAMQTSGSCYVVSVLKYLSFGTGVDAGFMVTPSPLQTCDITVTGSCVPSQMLTVGLNDSVKAGFSTVQLNCPPSTYAGPANIDGYAVCQMGIPNTTITVSGTVAGVLDGTVLFDSGTPAMVFNVPSGTNFPSVPLGSSVSVAVPSGFTYSYTAGSGSQINATTVQLNTTAESIVGVGYFTSNAFFIDFTTDTEGWN